MHLLVIEDLPFGVCVLCLLTISETPFCEHLGGGACGSSVNLQHENFIMNSQ